MMVKITARDPITKRIIGIKIVEVNTSKKGKKQWQSKRYQ